MISDHFYHLRSWSGHCSLTQHCTAMINEEILARNSFFSSEKHRSAAVKMISWCWHCTTGSTAWRGKAGGGGGEVGGGGGGGGRGGGWGKGKQPPKVRRKALLCKALTNAIMQNWISHYLASSVRRKKKLFFGHKISELFFNPLNNVVAICLRTLMLSCFRWLWRLKIVFTTKSFLKSAANVISTLTATKTSHATALF